MIDIEVAKSSLEGPAGFHWSDSLNTFWVFDIIRTFKFSNSDYPVDWVC